MKIIELSGQPCAGKSFLYKKIKDYYISDPEVCFADDLKKPNIRELMHSVLEISVILKPKYFTELVKIPRTFTQRIAIIFNLLKKIVIYRKILHGSSKSKLIIFDEGITHSPYLFDGNLFLVLITNRLFEKLSVKPLVLHITANKKLIMSRLHVRGHKRLKDNDVQTINEFTTVYKNVSNKYKSYFSQEAIEIVEIAHSMDLLSVVSEVINSQLAKKNGTKSC